MAGYPRVSRRAGGSLEAKKGPGGRPSGRTPPSKEDWIEEFTRAQKRCRAHRWLPCSGGGSGSRFKIQAHAEAAELALESLDPSLSMEPSPPPLGLILGMLGLVQFTLSLSGGENGDSVGPAGPQ